MDVDAIRSRIQVINAQVTAIQRLLEDAPRKKPEYDEEMTSEAIKVLTFLNVKSNRNYRPVQANLQLILARLKDGITADQCRQVIVRKCNQWIGDPNMKKYLRPATLFNRTLLEQYLGELGT